MRNYARLFLLLCVALIFLARADVTVPARNPFVPTAIAPIQNATAPLITTPKIHSCWIPLYFSQAKTIAAFLSHQSSGILSPLGKINFDKRSNQVWLEDDAQHIAQVRTMIQHLDQPGPQFLIKAKIINIDRRYQKN